MIAASRNMSSVRVIGDNQKSLVIAKINIRMFIHSIYFLTIFYMDNSNSDSGANTLLIVVILVILVGFAVWWFTSTRTGSATQEDAGINVDLKLPTGDGSSNPSE